MDKLFYGKQTVEEDDIQAVVDVLKGPLITCGPKVVEFEKRLCEYTGANYAVAVSSGTAALHCACIAAGIGPGDEVITTPITFAASANCALYCGATPVFADIDPDTYNIDTNSIRKNITQKTKAIIAVDYTGQVVEVNTIRQICDEHNLIFIEDAAHSIGSSYNGVKVGNIADYTTFSFHPVKTITGGEGGAILTNDGSAYKRLLLARGHGITHDKDLMEDLPHEGIWCYEQIGLGYNYRMTDFQSAMLISQLGKIERFKERRREISKKYELAFKDIQGIILQKTIPESDTCRHIFVIQLDLDKLTCTRREFFDEMSAKNIQCQVHYIPVYWFPYYQKMGYKRGLCPVAENVYRGILSIPLYPLLTDEEVDYVIYTIKSLVEKYCIK
ncbi:MAG: UDP-4-amino-4,6-dideoxy-N-acetyl-beta-L-altrosamine transaminase [Pseudobutyrivibrio sp.]|nr:UDP-4-amino-4,6-dideoxy-N-acetyl-beta-L-altrosamine transaminase [Pseudobutyrivibrio sp.]